MAETILIGEAARRLKRHPVTVKTWEKQGLLTPYRDYRGWRYYDSSEIERLRIDSSDPTDPESNS